MSNLGWYQILTSMAKKVGGPKNLIGIFVGSGVIIGGVAVCGAVCGGNAIKRSLDKKKQIRESAIIYTVDKEGKSNEGLLFEVGDRFKVLERDGDACLIEIEGNNNNPYFVSGIFLSSISDYGKNIIKNKYL